MFVSSVARKMARIGSRHPIRFMSSVPQYLGHSLDVNEEKKFEYTSVSSPVRPLIPESPAYCDDHPVMNGSLSPPPGVQVRNFSPGPTCLPAAVEADIKNLFHAERLCSMYLSHRSPEFLDILSTTKQRCHDAMHIPDDYEILFMHGGGHGQFAAVPFNLCSTENDKATYIVNGTWSKRAAIEGSKYCNARVISSEDNDSFVTSPSLENIDMKSKFIYLCSNETVNGIEMHRLPKFGPDSPPLVVDASSDFSTKEVEWIESNVGILYACASKNIGHPGVTMVVVRKDLLGQKNSMCPGVLCYDTNIKGGNLWNTIATFNVEVIGIFMKWMIEQGGVKEMERRSIAKADMCYDLIDFSDGFYTTPISDKSIRSRMNIPFTVGGGNNELTKEFLIELWKKGIVGLRTNTPFGFGDHLRASLYNGVTLCDVKELVFFMKEFMHNNRYRMNR